MNQDSEDIATATQQSIYGSTPYEEDVKRLIG